MSRRLTNGKDTQEYQYDLAGQLQVVTGNVGGETQRIEYEWDELGRKTSVAYPLDGVTVKTRYEYDAWDRLTRVIGADGSETRYEYDIVGNRVRTIGETIETLYEYDNIYNIIKQVTTGETSLALEYEYDALGRMISEVRTEGETTTTSSYAYDKLSRIATFARVVDGDLTETETYKYDAVGNITQKIVNDTRVRMTYGKANELLTMRANGKTIDYDYNQNGDLTRKTLIDGKAKLQDEYSYDSFGNLAGYDGYDGYSQRLSSVMLGLRVEKRETGDANRLTLEELLVGKKLDNSTRNGILEDVESGEQNDLYNEETRFDAWTTTRYLQDITTGYGVVLAETTERNANPAEKLVTSYEYGLERLSGLTARGSDRTAYTRTLRSEYVYDARGSVVQTVEKSSNVENISQSNNESSSLIDIHSFSYTPFGELSGAKSSGYRFNGEEYDAATGMLNLRVRQYEPAMMRFSQMDLVRGDVAKPITLNRYVYCYDEPVGFVDPSGMRPPESGTYVGDDKYYDENGNLKGSESGTAKPTATPKATAKPTATPKATAQATATPSPTSSSNNNNSSGSSNSNSSNSIWDNVVNTVKNVVDTVVTTVKKVVKKVQGVISDAIEDLVSQQNIADLINQLSNSQLSDHQRTVIMNAIVEQQNLQNANASVSMRQAAFNKVCAEVAQHTREENIIQQLPYMTEQDLLFITSSLFDDMTLVERYDLLTSLKRNDGKLTYDDLVRMGIYKAEEIKKDSWLDIFGGNAPRDFVSLTELAYRLSRNSASFGEVSDAEILNRLATLNRLLALAGYNLANSLIYGPGGVVYDLNSRFDYLEATGTPYIKPSFDIKTLPQNVQDAYKGYESVNWRGNYPGQAKGTGATGVWQNNRSQLPTKDIFDQPITYKEYDVNSKLPNMPRDSERFLLGNDNSLYYTNDHYITFQKIR